MKPLSYILDQLITYIYCCSEQCVHFLQYIYVTFRKTYSMASVLSILRTHFHVEQPPLETGEGDDPKHDPLDIGWERRATEAAS